MKKKIKIIALVIISLVLLSISFGCISSDEKDDDDKDEKNGDKNTFIVTISGTDTITFSVTDLEKMNTIERKVSYQNKMGNFVGEGTYKAVAIQDILATCGQGTHSGTKSGNNDPIMEPGDTLKISAADGYSQEYCYYNVFPPASWYRFQGDFALAYSMDGEIVPTWESGFMPVFLPEDNEYSAEDSNATSAPGQGYFKSSSAGARFVKNAVKLEVISNQVDEWQIELKGELTEQFTKTDYEILESYYPSSYTNETGATWTGVPLWRILGRFDDNTPRGEDSFNETLSASGYEVVITAGDDYSKNITSGLISKNDKIILASTLNSAELPEKNKPVWVVGEGLKTSQMVFNVVKIEIK